MKIHAFNVEELAHSNIIFILSASFSLEDQQQVLDVMERKVHHAQMAYYVDTSRKVSKGMNENIIEVACLISTSKTHADEHFRFSCN